jgi:hypothetical protein
MGAGTVHAKHRRLCAYQKRDHYGRWLEYKRSESCTRSEDYRKDLADAKPRRTHSAFLSMYSATESS